MGSASEFPPADKLDTCPTPLPSGRRVSAIPGDEGLVKRVAGRRLCGTDSVVPR